MEYKLRCANLVAKALSRRVNLPTLVDLKATSRTALRKGFNIIYLPKPSSNLLRMARHGDFGKMALRGGTFMFLHMTTFDRKS